MNEVALAEKDRKLDDVMLAMDVVDTLRHRERMISRELSVEDRRAALIDRLREIYKAQGIDVPDRILEDGVTALEEKRFAYEPPQNSLAVGLAKFYIGRDRWLAPVLTIVALAAIGAAIWQFAIAGPREARAEAARIELAETLPEALSVARDEALALAETGAARERVETAYRRGVAAIEDGDAGAARAEAATLDRLADVLAQSLAIRIVSEPGEFSGVFRESVVDPNVVNYYLIVEAVDASGERQALEVTNEELFEVEWTERWGVRVSEADFNRVAADKQNDQIIQKAEVGEKPRGALSPVYSIETDGGAILEW